MNKVFATLGADDPKSSQNDLETLEVALKTHFDAPKIMFSSLKTSYARFAGKSILERM